MTAMPPFTLGIEEEFQLVDGETLELKSHVSQMLKESEEQLPEHIRRELHKSVIEIGSKVCTPRSPKRQHFLRDSEQRH